MKKDGGCLHAAHAIGQAQLHAWVALWWHGLMGRTHVRIKGQKLHRYLKTHSTSINIFLIRLQQGTLYRGVGHHHICTYVYADFLARLCSRMKQRFFFRGRVSLHTSFWKCVDVSLVLTTVCFQCPHPLYTICVHCREWPWPEPQFWLIDLDLLTHEDVLSTWVVHGKWTNI